MNLCDKRCDIRIERRSGVGRNVENVASDRADGCESAAGQIQCDIAVIGQNIAAINREIVGFIHDQ